MTKLLPSPLLSLFLLGFWLLLQNSVSVGQIILGSFLAVGIPLFTHRGLDYRTSLHRPKLIMEYLLLVFIDIIQSNIDIAAIILLPSRRIRPALIEYPLEIKGEIPLAVLASTITLTPGTVSAELGRDGNSLLIHALNVDDHEQMINDIKRRYESRLKEIFKC